MMATLKAEFRKLLSVRSTYILSVVGLVLAGTIAFWGNGLRGPEVFMPSQIQDSVYNNFTIVSIFTGIVAVLLICHEYRYSTIGYTFTASNNRLKVLLAKLAVTGVYAVIMGIVTIFWVIGLITLGAHIGGHHIGTQIFDVTGTLWKTMAYSVGGVWFGLFLGAVSRSLVFAIVAYFAIPTVEPILHALLKVSNNAMPMTAQNQILLSSDVATPGVYSPLASAGVFGLYLLGLGIVAAVLFMRKDAN